MNEKIVKARKEYKCDRCGGIIREGNLHKHISGREPRYADDHETQIGIKYESYRTCLKDMCEGFLMYVVNPKKYMQQCVWGVHEWELEYELDDYVGGHAVGVPTGRMRCKNCGIVQE